MSKHQQDGALFFLPLGGAGEIGMNLYLYGYKGKWLIVDCGVAFGDAATPGVDLVMADPAFIVERVSDLVGIVLTHGHEDHMGAIPYLWERFQCPVYATGFTADLVRGKLEDAGLEDEVEIKVVKAGRRFKVGPFEIEYVAMTHSIPEAHLLAIRTKAGMIVHTGDWKLDPAPILGPLADEARLAELGEEGVLALVCDSTNVFLDGHSGSEAEVRESLVHLIGHYPRRIAVACFATNVARLDSISHAAKANGRHVALAGRSLWRIEKAARKNGYLKGVAEFLTDRDGMSLPDDKALFICTGSQGEARAALSRIAHGDHPNVELGSGDVVIFSSKIIPGNEKEIHRVQNGLARRGVEIVTDEDHFVHVSGHPGRDELKRLYALLKPRIAIPMHGEDRHLLEHAELARSLDVPEVLIARNGSEVRLAPGAAEIVDHVPTGKLAMDGGRLIRLDSPVMRNRTRMIWNGHAVVTVVVDKKGRLLADPKISAQGLLDPETDAHLLEEAEQAVAESIEDMSGSQRKDDAVLSEAIRIAARRALYDRLEKKPLTEVHLIRV
ncbi:Predicted hydrolase of the metallo-beta-lactamase superfamily [Rhodospirillaceae bacterium LM-1]|nr:Predicted hydrolase of the metallo-beta-lactamase superfamily [Rhodospirillaceae bacterium LM-1]